MARVTLLFCAALGLFRAAHGSALDDIKLTVGPERCQGFDSKVESLVVRAANANPSRVIDATFKYDSIPSKQHFILFDSKLVPASERFPKSVGRRVSPLESIIIGCSVTQRSAPTLRDSQVVALAFTKESATYSDGSNPAPSGPDGHGALAFFLQGGAGECPAGANPPGLFYAVNLHPYARLSATIGLQEAQRTQARSITINLSPFSSTKIGCSNGATKPNPASLTEVALEVVPGAISIPPAAAAPASKSEMPPQPNAAAAVAERQTANSLPLKVIVGTQNICAGSTPPGWVKINEAWNPTVCGQPAAVTFNVWTLQHIAEQPIGAIVYACTGPTPPDWKVLERVWNPTVCGQPADQQANVMVIQRSQ